VRARSVRAWALGNGAVGAWCTGPGSRRSRVGLARVGLPRVELTRESRARGLCVVGRVRGRTSWRSGPGGRSRTGGAPGTRGHSLAGWAA